MYTFLTIVYKSAPCELVTIFRVIYYILYIMCYFFYIRGFFLSKFSLLDQSNQFSDALLLINHCVLPLTQFSSILFLWLFCLARFQPNVIFKAENVDNHIADCMFRNNLFQHMLCGTCCLAHAVWHMLLAHGV